jgi:hypothetical protein
LIAFKPRSIFIKVHRGVIFFFWLQDVDGLVIKFSITTHGTEQAGDMQMKLLEAVSDEGRMFGSSEPRENNDGVDQKDRDLDTSKSLQVYQRDAFLLFRALCKISMRQSDPSSDVAMEMRSKILSLELLLILLGDAHDSFFATERVVQV